MHGHRKSDLRHLHLHRLALAALRDRPDLRRQCLDLALRWSSDPDHAPSRQWLAQWCDMLTDWPLEKVARVVLDPEEGQTLRQCSPLGPTLTPQERWAALAEINQRIESGAADTDR